MACHATHGQGMNRSLLVVSRVWQRVAEPEFHAYCVSLFSLVLPHPTQLRGRLGPGVGVGLCQVPSAQTSLHLIDFYRAPSMCLEPAESCGYDCELDQPVAGLGGHWSSVGHY